MGPIVRAGIRIITAFFAGVGAEQVADRVTGSDGESKAIRFSFGGFLVLLLSLLVSLFFVFKNKKKRRK